MQLDCTFSITPRIVLSDKNLSSTEKLLMGLIVSLILKNNYCFASNKYFANNLNISVRTVTLVLSKLKLEEYIFVKTDNGRRKIYLNKEKIPIKTFNRVAESCDVSIASNFYHNINNNYKKKNNKYKNKEIIPVLLEQKEMCNSLSATKEEIEEMNRRVSIIDEEIDYIKEKLNNKKQARDIEIEWNFEF